MKRCLLTFLALFLTLGIAHAGKPNKPSGPSYSIVRLDDGGGAYSGYSGVAFDINDVDEAVGQVEDSTSPQILAAFWTVNGSSSQISILSGGNQATGVNNYAESVGGGYDRNGEHRGMYWASPTSPPTILPPLAGGLESLAIDINDEGVICGYSLQEIPDSGGQLKPAKRAVAWRVTTNSGQITVYGPKQLPTLDDYSIANAVSQPDANGYVTIVGGYEVLNGPQSAAVQWGIKTLGDGSFIVDPLPTILEVGEAVANAVTSGGISCGAMRLSSTSRTEARVWDGPDGVTLDSGNMYHVSAMDLNGSGVTVGWETESAVYEALIWPSLASRPVPLSKFLPRRSPFVYLSEANALNTTGKIVGTGWTGDGYAPFVAIPE